MAKINPTGSPSRPGSVAWTPVGWARAQAGRPPGNGRSRRWRCARLFVSHERTARFFVHWRAL